MRYSILAFLICIFYAHLDAKAQVLTSTQHKHGSYGLNVDKGSSGVWFQLKKLQTTASVMHTTAHPDDEHAGLLTGLSRGQGVRTALLTINRGEAGANATGSELFDALGLIRTEELLRSGQYYGLDDQYFTTLTDYGYSKTVEEALRSWGKEAVLEDMVRIIRMNRPLVVISRFQGSRGDGHGHHQAAGSLTPEAFLAAGDSTRFPDQIRKEGLRPWSPMKLFRGGVSRGRPHHVAYNHSTYDPVLGDTYLNFGYYGLSLQRSQTSGRVWSAGRGSHLFYRRLYADAIKKEDGFFEGMDTSISGMYALFGLEAPDEIVTDLNALEQFIEQAISEFDWQAPEASVPALVQALKVARALKAKNLHDEVGFLIEIKIEQIQETISTALGLHLEAIAMLPDAAAVMNAWSPLPTLQGVVLGQHFQVQVDIQDRGKMPYYITSVGFDSRAGFAIDRSGVVEEFFSGSGYYMHESGSFVFPVQVTEEATFDRPNVYRSSVKENQYSTITEVPTHLPRNVPAMSAIVWYNINGEEVRIRRPVQMRRANFPYGYKLEILRVLPQIALNVTPDTRMIPLKKDGAFSIEVEVTNNDVSGSQGTLALKLPEGWRSIPENHSFDFSDSGEKATYQFDVNAKYLRESGGGSYMIQVEGIIDGEVYTDGYERVKRNELETQYLYETASIHVQSVHVDMVEGLNVGYVMGVGDEVPAGIEQLGAIVHLLDESDLSRGNLDEYDVIVVGTRAYAVRGDLLNNNNRLIEFARRGGHLIVLYQTPEYIPDEMAPYPATLPRNAEEVSEQDAPVTVLMPDHPVFHFPNTITSSDFDGWVEQRGSKFFATWDERYLPLLEMNDTGQRPQEGAWLTAEVGDGHFTYFALAIHRQTPYAVPGPYRIFANVLSMGH